MTLDLHQASVPVFRQMLTGLSGILDKAAAHCAARKIDPNALLQARLYPDMFPLVRQVQVAADFAKNSVARLAGVEPVKVEDTEKTFDELKARIEKTIAMVNGASAEQINAGIDRTINYTAGGQPKSLPGKDYLFHFGLPHFYFHVAMAYAILRHNGVEIGKRDYMGNR
jgi:hypothetical protein